MKNAFVQSYRILAFDDTFRLDQFVQLGLQVLVIFARLQLLQRELGAIFLVLGLSVGEMCFLSI